MSWLKSTWSDIRTFFRVIFDSELLGCWVVIILFVGTILCNLVLAGIIMLMAKAIFGL